MDYMEMMIENNKKLFAGEVPFYAEEPTYPEVEEIEEDCGSLYDGYYGYGNNNGKFTDDEYEELFPGVLRPKKFDYSKRPESETYENLYDEDGFAIMETIGDRTQDKYRYKDKSYAELRAMYNNENREIVNNLLGVDEDDDENGFPVYYDGMSKSRKRWLIRKFKQDPLWFLTKRERIDLMIDDNIQEQSTYNATNYIYKYVYDYSEEIEKAKWYRLNKYVINTDWFQSLDLWECFEFNMVFNYEMYLRPDKDPMTKNKRKLYDDAIARFRQDHDVSAFFDGILDASSGTMFSKLKQLELAMIEAGANVNDDNNNEFISGLITGSIDDARINNNCVMNVLKDGKNPPIPDRVVLRGDKFPEEITDPKEIQKHMLSEIDDVDIEKLKVRAQAEAELKETEARRLAERILDNKKPKSIFELLGVEFDPDDELSVQEAREKIIEARKKIKSDYVMLSEDVVIPMKPIYLWMTSRQIKEQYPEAYEELVQQKKIEPTVDDWLADQKVKDYRTKRLEENKEDIDILKELEGVKTETDEDIDAIIARINERKIGDDTVIEMDNFDAAFDESDLMKDGKDNSNLIGKLTAMRERRDGIRNDYIGTRRYIEERHQETPEELKARFMGATRNTLLVPTAIDDKTSLEDYTFEELQEAVLMRDETVLELLDEIPYKERYQMLKKLRPDFTALNIPECLTDRDDDLTTKEILDNMDSDIQRVKREAEEDPDLNNPLEEYARDRINNIKNEMENHPEEYDGDSVYDVMRKIYYN